MFRTRHKKSVLVFWALITAVGSLSFLQTLVWSIYKGLCQTGAWGCFYELSCISVDMFSVAAVYVKTLQDGIWPRNKGRWGIVIFRLTFVLSYGTITFFWFLGETTELKMADFHSNKSRKKEMFQKKTKALFWWVYKKNLFFPFFLNYSIRSLRPLTRNRRRLEPKIKKLSWGQLARNTWNKTLKSNGIFYCKTDFKELWGIL